MKFETTFFHCGEYLKETLAKQVEEVQTFISAIKWSPDFQFADKKQGGQKQGGRVFILDKMQRCLKTTFTNYRTLGQIETSIDMVMKALPNV